MENTTQCEETEVCDAELDVQELTPSELATISGGPVSEGN
jgi:hypothetical protein